MNLEPSWLQGEKPRVDKKRKNLKNLSKYLCKIEVKHTFDLKYVQ